MMLLLLRIGNHDSCRSGGHPPSHKPFSIPLSLGRRLTMRMMMLTHVRSWRTQRRRWTLWGPSVVTPTRVVHGKSSSSRRRMAVVVNYLSDSLPAILRLKQFPLPR